MDDAATDKNIVVEGGVDASTDEKIGEGGAENIDPSLGQRSPEVIV